MRSTKKRKKGRKVKRSADQSMDFPVWRQGGEELLIKRFEED